jgi:hypothetical protein
MLSTEEVAAVRRMLDAGNRVKDIARTFGVSCPCIHAYKSGLRVAHDAPPVFVMPKPHAMPWATPAMLMGGRAPVAKSGAR